MLIIGRAEDERVDPWPAKKRLASVARSPEIHVVAGSTEHDVAVRRTAWCGSAVRPAEDDVVTGTTVHDIVAIQSEHDVVVRAAGENVSSVEGLIGASATLNQRVRLNVIVQSDEQPSPLAAFDDGRLCRASRARDDAQEHEQQEGRQRGKTDAGRQLQLTHLFFCSQEESSRSHDERGRRQGAVTWPV